ncbi:MAG: hypothetical protein AAF581_02235 [Planctomycetota bacterium]
MRLNELPSHCPECHDPLSKVLRPKPQMQRKAVLLIVIGAALCVPWGLVTVPLVDAWAEELRRGLVRLVVVFVTALLPAIVAGAIAFRLPQVLRIQCRGCGWSSVEPFEPLR